MVVLDYSSLDPFNPELYSYHTNVIQILLPFHLSVRSAACKYRQIEQLFYFGHCWICRFAKCFKEPKVCFKRSR